MPPKFKKGEEDGRDRVSRTANASSGSVTVPVRSEEG